MKKKISLKNVTKCDSCKKKVVRKAFFDTIFSLKKGVSDQSVSWLSRVGGGRKLPNLVSADIWMTPNILTTPKGMDNNKNPLTMDRVRRKTLQLAYSNYCFLDGNSLMAFLMWDWIGIYRGTVVFVNDFSIWFIAWFSFSRAHNVEMTDARHAVAPFQLAERDRAWVVGRVILYTRCRC